MEYKDYYKILGVNKNATEKEIKSAYRKLARKYHPDVNAGANAEERFKEINEANEALSDPEKRNKYDQFGADWHRWQQGGGQPGGFDWGQWQTAANGQPGYEYYGNLNDIFGGVGGGNAFSDFFSAIFGGMNVGNGGAQQAGNGFNGFNYASPTQRGQDIESEVEISLTEAYHGATRLLNKEGRRLNVKIPAGVKTGSKVRVRGEGVSGIGGGQPGDLYLKIKVASDPRFERAGDDLHTTVPVDLYTAVLGGEIRAPTLTGEAKLRIPPGTQNGQKFRLRGKGMPNSRQKDQPGDLYARVEVRLPEKITPKQQDSVDPNFIG